MTTLSKPDKDGLVFSEWMPTLKFRQKVWPSKAAHVSSVYIGLQQLHFREVYQEPKEDSLLQFVGGRPHYVRTEHKWIAVPFVETTSDEETL